MNSRVVFFILIFFMCGSAPALVNNWFTTLPEDSDFQVSKDMRARVDFWVKIYSHYTTTQGVFHLVDNPARILGEIDLTDIYENKVLTDTQKRRQIEALVKKKKKLYMARHKIRNARSVRLQMGLKDRMRKAFYISGKYLPQMEEIFEKEKLPIELTRLVFVESSFNVFAQSKVGASGLWQIMPFVAKPKGYITSHYDKRNHPIYATKLAAQILKQNHNSLKSWPLAVTAYNHGLTGVKRMVQRTGSSKIERLIASRKPTRTWGFASKNFYACFLAVLEVERNAPELFGDSLIKASELSYKEYRLPEKTGKDVVLKWFNGSITRFKQMNPHLNWARLSKHKFVPAGVPLMIPEKNFSLVDN